MLTSKGGHFKTLRELTECMRASMLLPGITGPMVSGWVAGRPCVDVTRILGDILVSLSGRRQVALRRWAARQRYNRWGASSLVRVAGRWFVPFPDSVMD